MLSIDRTGSHSPEKSIWANAGAAARNISNSTFFTFTRETSAGEVSNLIVNGRGYGHGIGMCQWGAIGRARAGQNYRTILETYYPGTTIGRIAG